MIHIFFTPSHIFRTIHENRECWRNEQQLHWEGRQIRISTISRTLGTVFAASSPPLHCEATTAVVPHTGHGSHTKSATNAEVVTGLWTTCYKQACRGSREFTLLRSPNPEDDRNRSFTDGDNKTTNRFLVAAQVPQCRLNRWSQFFRKFVKFHTWFVKSTCQNSYVLRKFRKSWQVCTCSVSHLIPFSWNTFCETTFAQPAISQISIPHHNLIRTAFMNVSTKCFNMPNNHCITAQSIDNIFETAFTEHLSKLMFF